MSRDWRPVEQYAADKAMKHSLRNIELKSNDTLLYNPDARRDYPELSFLFEHFDKLYAAYRDNKNVRSLFYSMEKELHQIESEFDKTDSVDINNRKLYNLSVALFREQPQFDVVEEWFYGRLDADFYYREENDSMFKLYIMNKIHAVE